MERIKGYVDHIIYRNSENGYTVLVLIGEDEEITCVGTLHYIGEGEAIEAEGSYKEHSTYGRQFVISSYEIKAPEDVLSIERYLGSGAIKGVGAALAARIVKKFKADTFRIIEEEPERLAEVKGISERKAREIAEQVEEKKDMRKAMIFLQQYGISNALSVRIYNTYGPELYQVIKENPYRMADDIDGIGFRIADEIASRVGIHTDSDFRIRSGLLYVLQQASQEGHIYLPEPLLLERTVQLLGVSRESVEKHVMDLAVDRKLILKETDGEVCVYSTAAYYLELNTAKMLHDLNISCEVSETAILTKVAGIEKKREAVLDEMQKYAVVKAAGHGLLVITGGPGTGKTTTINALIDYFESEGLNIRLAAPTGRAAKRMTEATGCEAQTIHRLLEVSGGGSEESRGQFGRNAEHPLDEDVVIIDEMSMVDIYLIHALLLAIPVGTRLILVGDVNQLPSVGPGSVLKDIIDSGRFPVVRLTKIFRQAQSSRIIMNAHRINEGKFPDISNGRNTDFFFLEDDNPEHAAGQIVDLVKRRLPKAYRVPTSSIQVLTPMQRGVVGAANLNRMLQEAVNPTEILLRRSGLTYRLHDRVMQIKNNYDKEVFNGDIGSIQSIDLENRTLSVQFDDRPVEYNVTELDELALAYATTIHKAQGSEYPIVVMPILMTHYVMLQRNMLYTGITRAKKLLVLIGSRKALRYAVHNVTVTGRNTRLAERLGAERENSEQRELEGT